MTALADLVRRAKEGDENAFAALYNARVTGLFRYVNSMLRNPTDAEDVTAQTFIEAWKSLRKLRDPKHFDAWLFRIGHNLALNERRRRPTTPLESAPEPKDPSPDSEPESFVEGMGEARAVRRALLRLPDALREVLVLRFFAGLSHAEVSAQIGKSENNARVMQYRALRQMRGLIEAEGVRLT